jgi:hypothetical protein
LLSVVSFGASEGGAQSAESARIGKTAAAIAALIERFIAAVRAVAASVGTIAARADEIAGELVGIREMRMTAAVLWTARSMPAVARLREFAAMNRLSEAARGLPELVAPLGQIGRKFKHAADFGVTLDRGKPGLEAFRDSLENFIGSPTTVRVSAARARFQSEPAILNYDPVSRLVVVQRPDGTFWSCWRMGAVQLGDVQKFARLGRG